MTTIELPEGVEHGTPEGHQAGCKGERNCPARYTHGMTCTDAHVRSLTTPYRYFKAKARGAAPEQIARTLNFRPATRAEDAAAAADEERRSEAARLANQYRAARRETPEPAQPLVEHSQDPSDTTPAPAGEVAAATPAKAPAEGEEMGHPTPRVKAPAKPVKNTKPKTLTQALESAQRKRTSPAGPSQNLVRAWARENGIDVNPRGSVRTDVVNAYLAAHPDTPTPPAAPTVTADDLDAWATDHPDPTRIENITDRIDELRPRIDMPAPTPSENPRPEWATVTTSTDVETARRETTEAQALATLHQQLAHRRATTAARLEQELAHTTQQLHTAHTALTTALAAWEAASDRAAVAERAALIAEGRAVAAEKRASSAETLRVHESRAHEARMDLAAARRAELNDIIDAQQAHIEQLETAAKATWWRRAS